jgi:hypothetical protein
MPAIEVIALLSRHGRYPCIQGIAGTRVARITVTACRFLPDSPSGRATGCRLSRKVAMLVRLTKKLADVVNDVDLSSWAEGDVIDLPEAQAQMLIAERWAEPVAHGESSTHSQPGRHERRAVAADRGRP